MSASDFEGLRFTVTVHELASGWRVHVESEDEAGEATATFADLATSLMLASAFMHGVCVPDPLAELFRRPSAQDGPGDLG